MELDRRHLDRPDDAGELGDAELVGMQAVAGEVEADRLDPGRGPGGRLVHLRSIDALGEAVEHARPVAQRVDDAGAHREVVVGEVELGLARSEK